MRKKLSRPEGVKRFKKNTAEEGNSFELFLPEEDTTEIKTAEKTGKKRGKYRKKRGDPSDHQEDHEKET